MSELTRRRRLGARKEVPLALLPTATVLLVLAFVEGQSSQRLLFASLASSVFLIYLDPEHAVNNVRTLFLTQMGTVVIGLLSFTTLGPGYLSGGVAMVLAITTMIMLDTMHPPAVSTALSFGLRAEDETNLVLFCLAVTITGALVVLQRAALWMLRRFPPTP